MFKTAELIKKPLTTRGRKKLRMWGIASGLILPILLKMPDNSSGNAPVFESEVFYCEGCLTDLVVGKKVVRMRVRPDRIAPSVQGPSPSQGTKLEATNDFLTRTLSVGRIKILKATILRGLNFGNINRLSKVQERASAPENQSYSLSPGELIEELQYLGEGSCLARIKSQVVEVFECRWLEGFNPDTNPDSGHFDVMNKCQTETWIKVRELPNKREGWVLEEDLW